MTIKNDAKFEEELTCHSKIQKWGIWQILIRALKSLKKLNCDGLLLNKVYNIWTKYIMFEQSIQCLNKVYNVWTKYTMFELKKYRGVMFHETEEWCKIWRKTDLYFPEWHEEFVKFLQAEK